MKLDVKEKWIKALRSGEYPQATGSLRSVIPTFSYCCLGVLCDLHAKETGGEWNGYLYKGWSNYLPEVVQQWAGLTSDNPIVKFKGRTEGLANLNDDEEDFQTISQIIERQL